jgi:hypothetical protein
MPAPICPIPGSLWAMPVLITLTLIPKSTPLRAIAVTTVEPSMPCAASRLALQAAIDRFKKKKLFWLM